ncbi:MAG: lipopolysaccharide biosynthesis protein [Acidobacteriota bacterium]
MYRKIARLGKHSLVYGVGSLGTRVLGFLLIPVYTRYLTPADYGVLALCTATVGILKIVSLAGIPTALFRSYLLTARSDQEKRKVLGTGLAALLIAGAAILLLLLVLRRPLAFWLFGSDRQVGFVVLIAWLNFAYIFQAVRNTHFRMQDQSIRFSIFTLLAFALNLALAVYLVVGRGQGAWGAMSANMASVAVMAALFLPWSLRQLRRGISAGICRDLLGYGLPLIPSTLALWAMNLSDIYILRIFRSGAEIGLYNLGYKFGMGVYILTNAFKFAFPKVLFTEARTPQGPLLFQRLVNYYTAGIGYLCTGVAIYAPELILVADPKFHAAYRVIPLAVFAYFLFGLVPLLGLGIDVTGRMHLLSVVFLGGAGANIALNLLLIPRFGMLAAAGTTLATYILVPAAVYLVSRRLYPLRLEWNRLARAAVLLAAIGAGSLLIPFPSLPARLLAKLLLLLLYPPALWLSGFFRQEEKEKIRTVLSRLPVIRALRRLP